MTLPLAGITVGERDRSDLGDLAALADSIKSVGLLHPIVVTADGVLVAGGRRLEAARMLGWGEVPVTVVDLASAAEQLRAEADENTCRKQLTPYEASRARERRAQVLAADAAKRKAQAPGQPRGSRKVSSSKLDGENSSARLTRKVAANGTGYSGSTLDKVDTIRRAAEDGTVTLSGQQIPVPEPVREAAAASLEVVKQTGAAVDGEHRKVRVALAEFLNADPERKHADIRKKTLKLVGQVMDGLPSCDVAEIAEAADDALVANLINADKSLHEWVARVQSSRAESLAPVRSIR